MARNISGVLEHSMLYVSSSQNVKWFLKESRVLTMLHASQTSPSNVCFECAVHRSRNRSWESSRENEPKEHKKGSTIDHGFIETAGVDAIVASWRDHSASSGPPGRLSGQALTPAFPALQFPTRARPVRSIALMKSPITRGDTTAALENNRFMKMWASFRSDFKDFSSGFGGLCCV